MNDGFVRPEDEDGSPPARATGISTGEAIAPPAEASGLTADGRLRSGKLAGLSMWAAIWVLAWPILTESFLNSTVGLVDTMIAAQISEAATDAISGAGYTLWFVGLIAMAIGVGATALVSRAVGAGRMAVANAATAQAVLLALVGGVMTGAIIAAAAAPMSRVLHLEGEARDAFVTYLRVVALGVPALTLVASGIACARGAGDSVRPLLSMVVINVVNMVASVVLSGAGYRAVSVVDGRTVVRQVFENPFGLNMGVAGIAWGTVIGEWVGAAVILLILARGWAGVRLLRHRLRPHWHTVRRLIRVGIPNFLETFGMWVGNFLVFLMVGWVAVGEFEGGGTMGAHMVAIRIEAFSFLPGFAMGAAAATLAGQYLGAGSPRSARLAILRCTAVTVAIMGAAGLAFLMLPRHITGLISSQPAHLRLTPVLIFITGWVQIPFGIGIIFRSALRGVGDVKAVMWLTWLSTYAVRLPLAYALSGVDVPLPGGGAIQNPFRDTPSLPMLWVGLCAEIVVRAALFTARFAHGGWLRAKV